MGIPIFYFQHFFRGGHFENGPGAEIFPNIFLLALESLNLDLF